jgi:hypothetical protein
MSEIRKTTTIRRVEAPPPEPIITLADILAGVGWLAVNGAILAAKTGVLAYKGIRAASSSICDNQRTHLTYDDAAKLIRHAQDVRQAITALAEHPNLEIPKARAQLFKTRLEKLAATNDKAGTLTLATELLTTRQDRLHVTLMKLAAETCREIGFSNVRSLRGNGLVIAKSTDGRRTFRVDVEKTRDGGIQINRDSDGFHGGSCAPVHDAFDRVMRARGVRYDSDDRRRKHDRPVAHRGRVPQLIHVRRAK